jgi:hypothetical protein
MIGALYVAAYLAIRKIGRDGVKRERVSPVIREITAKLPEAERQAKADELWRDKAFIENTLTESYREKNWPFAIAFYLFWGGALTWFLYWLFTGLSKEMAQ